MRYLRWLMVVAAAFLWSAPVALPQEAMKGIALVIGQSKYEHLSPLPNPPQDVKAISRLFEDLGFEVDLVSDADTKKLQKAIRRFTEDAEDADAVLFYYSGHGIEAGGENWLVPVDADLDAPGDASERLVPISELLNSLKSTVPLTIVLLDACRSNPFPPGTLVKSRDQPEGVPVGGGGLSVPRGFTPVDEGTSESLGTVIGFAAEPGLPALDGDPGGNSPYAAAIVRHFNAMNGLEFGLVMRMITEEVYLKTKAQQRPWVNESLRRQLYFGMAPEEAKGEDGAITKERRQLLLTIAELPVPDRKVVEDVAKGEGVPMDALFAVLRAMGATNVPRDPESLQQALFSQAQKIKDLLAERKALDADDPDILRLVSAADRAITEGAIEAARLFLDQAKEKVRATKDTIEDIEKMVREKRIANAAVLERSADAAALAYDHKVEAEDYGEAYDWVKTVDDVLAWRYKNREADAWQGYGELSGTEGMYEKALSTYEVALTLVKREERPIDWAKTQNNIANTYYLIGKRGTGIEEFKSAIVAYRLALEEMTRKRDAKNWAQLQNNLGVSLVAYSERTVKDKDSAFAQAEFAYGQALTVRTRKDAPREWAETMVNLATLYEARGSNGNSEAYLLKAEDALNQALEVLTREAAFRSWSSAKNNLGIVLRQLGELRKSVADLKRGEAVYLEIIGAYPKDKFPIDWGQAMNNLGILYMSMGEMEVTNESFLKAVAQFDAALTVFTTDKTPNDWVNSKHMLAVVWNTMGLRTTGTAELEKAVLYASEVAAAFPREKSGDVWARSQMVIGSAHLFLGTRRQGAGDFEKSEAAFAGALSYYEEVGDKNMAELAANSLKLAQDMKKLQQ